MKEAETSRILNEKISELKEILERKETLFQSKEKKWAEVEKIVVVYARKDLELREKLTDIKYICDDPSSKRKITTVINENDDLHRKVEEYKKQLEEMKEQMTMQTEANPYDFESDFLQDGASQRIATYVPVKKNKSQFFSKPKLNFEPYKRQNKDDLNQKIYIKE